MRSAAEASADTQNARASGAAAAAAWAPLCPRLCHLEDTLGRASSLAAKLAGPHSRAVVAALLASADEARLAPSPLAP